MQIIRHPKLAEDIRDVARRYAEISERVASSFWRELDSVLFAIAFADLLPTTSENPAATTHNKEARWVKDLR